jgi:hypothetical protein
MKTKKIWSPAAAVKSVVSGSGETWSRTTAVVQYDGQNESSRNGLAGDQMKGAWSRLHKEMTWEEAAQKYQVRIASGRPRS